MLCRWLSPMPHRPSRVPLAVTMMTLITIGMTAVDITNIHINNPVSTFLWNFALSTANYITFTRIISFYFAKQSPTLCLVLHQYYMDKVSIFRLCICYVAGSVAMLCTMLAIQYSLKTLKIHMKYLFDWRQRNFTYHPYSPLVLPFLFRNLNRHPAIIYTT